jgi:cobalt-zinc-cadmium efflux system outer membrane protein
MHAGVPLGGPLGTPVGGRVAAAPLSVAAAQASLESAQLATRIQRRSIWAGPSITAGFETGDPGAPGILPTVGFAIPFPLLDRNRGPIAQADAERDRARAELTLAQVQSRVEIARARRELASAQARVVRDQSLVASANRVAALSLTGYREGASPLPTVLEAQRNARDVIAQYVDDLANVWIAIAELRALTLLSAPTSQTVQPR